MKNLKKILLLLALITIFITCISLVNKTKYSPPVSNGYLVSNGQGYKLYRHRDGGTVIYVAVASNGNVSVTK